VEALLAKDSPILKLVREFCMSAQKVRENVILRLEILYPLSNCLIEILRL